jgi:predicted DNA-binding transcriptional regulator YafY
MKKGNSAKKQKRPRPNGTNAMFDYCLEMHELFMDHQNDPNPERKFPDIAELAVRFERDERTIKRYLAYMRKSLKLPVAHIRERGGQGYTRRVVSFPAQHFSEGHFLLFVIAQKALEAGSPFGKQLKPICQQLAATLQGKTNGNLKDYESIISFHSAGFDAPAIPDPGVFDKVFKAALERREITADHRKAAVGAKPTHRRLRPLRIRIIGHAWYVWTVDAAIEKIRKFALNRLSNVHVTNKKFPPISPELKAELDRQLEDSMGAFTGGKAVEVELRITGDSAERVQEREVHPTQRITRHKDGSVTMHLHVAHTIDLENWILNLRGDAEVIVPIELRTSIHQIHCAGAARNGCVEALKR